MKLRAPLSLILAGWLMLLASAPGLRGAVRIHYWMWDSGQLPAYREAAREFERRNPNITVKITPVAWTDYWISLTTGFIAATAPDVFVNHTARFPEFAANRIMLDLSGLIARDGVDASTFLPGLFDQWSRGGQQFGLPKDWGTMALICNREMLAQAGIDESGLADLDWNPHDGGSFGRVLATLTLDAAGKNALDPNFDARRVVQHGLLLDGKIDGFGELSWASFAASAGFNYQEAAWATRYRYDDPALEHTLTWLRDAQRRCVIIPANQARQIGVPGLFAARKGAIALTGSWLINWFPRNVKFPTVFAPLPIGPQGRKTMINGLADSIWIGTKHPEEAWRWAKFLASSDAQSIVASYGVVFPAIDEAAQKSVGVMERNAGNVRVFIEQATQPQATFPYPISDFGSEIQSIATAAMDQIFLSDRPVRDILLKMNRDVNALFETRR